MKLSQVAVMLLVMLLPAAAMAQNGQEVVRSNVSETINGTEYYLHKVKQGETLSAISRAYHVTLDVIRNSNFGIGDGLQPGQIIKIPVSPTPKPQDEAPTSIRYHRVAARETIYSLTRQYNVSEEALRKANDGLTGGLMTGAVIKIPLPETEILLQQEKPEKNYFEYQAKSKESVYPLALRYRVSVDSIFAYNPGLDDNLQSGQIIRIPKTPTLANFVTHQIQRNQSVNKLARKYEIDADAIRQINPYIARRLQEGQVLRIPLPFIKTEKEPAIDSLAMLELERLKHEAATMSQEQSCHQMRMMGDYKVALLLPFDFATVDSVMASPASYIDDPNPRFLKPFAFIEFYEGFLMAIDSLEKVGLNVEVFVYDAPNSVAATQKIIDNPELRQMDLIIGPVYSKSFEMMADFAHEHQIPLVNPFSVREEVTMGNPHVFQVQPVQSDQVEALTDYLNLHFPKAQIFLTKHNEYRDQQGFGNIKSYFSQHLAPRPSGGELFYSFFYNSDNMNVFKKQAAVNNDNVVVAFTTNKVYIMELLRALNEMRNQYNITLIGMPDWLAIEGLDMEYLNNLDVHYLAKEYVDMHDKVDREFAKSFQQQYNAEPGEFAWSGYNTGIYFMSALMKYGSSFMPCIRYFDMELLNMGYDFEADGNNGFRNKNWKVVRMSNYRLLDVSTPLPRYDFSRPVEPWLNSER
ncbi:MAG TPA: LysM peptidoglycan-binding domain-containing protein [Bacteroidales bacterium]|nr:LysM peptidoglycan-binding domain-containing protein [Bacteroidales bacterium]